MKGEGGIRAGRHRETEKGEPLVVSRCRAVPDI